MSETANFTLGALLIALADAPETAGKFASWTGEGANEPISGEEISAQIAPEELSALAEQAGLSEAEVADKLAEEIPPLVDALPVKATEVAIAPAQPVLARQQTLQQASISVLAQASQLPRSAVLTLLQ
ncbi:YidB family protein [Streptomyces sp. NBC_00631]|uniref:YidB family protein n=1 Tax=Streptomyces sp. NBC_00631 TaxID=2975793 RepID=UPI0030E047E7